jgi:hypothetical protein
MLFLINLFEKKNLRTRYQNAAERFTKPHLCPLIIGEDCRKAEQKQPSFAILGTIKSDRSSPLPFLAQLDCNPGSSPCLAILRLLVLPPAGFSIYHFVKFGYSFF